MSEKPPTQPLNDFDARLKRLREETRPRGQFKATDQPTSGMGFAFAIASHLVAGVVGGSVIGYFFDKWLGTSPWGLIVFFFLGSAAGMLNVYRMVTGMGMALGYQAAPSSETGQRRAGESPADRGTNKEGGNKSG
jgi:ATP synthase protein I